MKIIYRAIKPPDNARLAELVRGGLKEHGMDIPGTAYFDPNLKDLCAYYKEKPCKRTYFAAVDAGSGGRVVGGIGVDEFKGQGGCAELQKLYVAKEYRGRGIGTALVGILEKEAVRLGYGRIYIETHSNLKTALRLYEKAGFRLMERPDFAQHETMDRFLIKDISGKSEEANLVKMPLMAGNTELKNRIVMPPIATYLSTEDGRVTDRLLDHYGELAEGGSIGMIVTGHSYICMQGKARERQLSFAQGCDTAGLKELARTIRQSGSKAMAQLNHAGSAAVTAASGMAPVSASSIVLPVTPVMGDGAVPGEMTPAQIRETAIAFADAAERACEAGFDGAEIHSAHAYLLNQFYSPLTNRRTDGYGGSLENRLRFHREVLDLVKARVGKDLTISVRLGGCDYREGGSTIGDGVYAAKVLQEHGADMISVTGGMCRYARDGHDEPGYFRDMSEAVRNAVDIPVLLTGGIRTAEQAEGLLASGAADLIGVGRELMKDPHWADKALG